MGRFQGSSWMFLSKTCRQRAVQSSKTHRRNYCATLACRGNNVQMHTETFTHPYPLIKVPHTQTENPNTHIPQMSFQTQHVNIALTHTRPGGTWLTVVSVEMLGFLASFAHDRALQETVDRVNLRMKKTQLSLSPHTSCAN